MSRPRLQPVVWTPPPRDARARARQSTPPMPRPRLIPLPGKSPEDVVCDPSGRLLTGVADGRILRLDPHDGSPAETLGDTGGRPLGLELLPSGALVVCDERRGLLHLDLDSGEVTVLVDHVAGVRLPFCSNASVAPDGTLYFTSSTDRFGLEHYLGDIYEHGGRGRLLRLTPDGAVETLLTGLHFANGVAVSHGGAAVTFVETGAYSVSRLWVLGPRAGQVDPVVEGLPGFPDNVGRDPDGTLWVAMASPRDARLDLLHRLPPFVRHAAWAVPERLQPPPRKTCFVLGIDDSGDGPGRIVADLQRPGDVFDFATGVARSGSHLYLAGLHVDAIAEVPLP